MSLEALLAHLSPSDDDLRAAHAEGVKRMKEAVSRIGIISLTSNEPAVRRARRVEVGVTLNPNN